MKEEQEQPESIPPERRRAPWWRHLVAMAILAAALALRVTGADWGLPGFCNSDEHRTVEAAAKMVGRRSLDPEFYNWPNHTGIYLNAALYPAVAAIEYASTVGKTFRANATRYLYLSRILQAVLGTIMVWVAYRVGTLYHWGTGLLVAGLFAFFPSYVEHSHYVAPDLPLTLFVLLVVLFAARYLRRPSWPGLLLMVAAAALATGTKYPGVMTTVLVAATVVAAHWGSLRKIVVRGVVALATFPLLVLAFTPYLVLHFGKVLAAIRNASKESHLGADGLSWLGNMGYYAASFLGGAGVLMLGFMVLGALALARRESWRAMPLFFGLFYWVALSSLELHWERWALPMYTSGLLLGAFGMVDALARARQATRRRGLAIAGAWAAVVLSCTGIALAGTVKTLSATLQDTRFVSLAYLEQQGITREDAIWDGASSFNPGSGPGAFQDVGRLGGRVRYVILSEYMYGRYLAAPRGYERPKELYSQALGLPLVKEFKPFPARHRLDVIDVDEVTLQNSRTFELANVAEGIRYVSHYLRDRDGMLVGPTIRIHKLPD